MSATLNRAQQVVISIATAAALMAVGRAAESRGSSLDGGWFGYAPLGSLPEGPFLYRHPVLRLLMWLVLVALWAIVSLWLFRTPTGVKPVPPSTDPPELSGRAEQEL